MAVVDGWEVRILDAVLPVLATITGPPSWRTKPIIVDGVSLDALGATATQPRIHLAHARTISTPENAPVTSHGRRVLLVAYIVADTQRVALQTKADLLGAIYAAEQTFYNALQGPVWEGDCVYDDRLSTAGHHVYSQELFVDLAVAHTAP